MQVWKFRQSIGFQTRNAKVRYGEIRSDSASSSRFCATSKIHSINRIRRSKGDESRQSCCRLENRKCGPLIWVKGQVFYFQIFFKLLTTKTHFDCVAFADR